MPKTPTGYTTSGAPRTNGLIKGGDSRGADPLVVKGGDNRGSDPEVVIGGDNRGADPESVTGKSTVFDPGPAVPDSSYLTDMGYGTTYGENP